ncbi:HNH endonuclease [Pollutibacter soli]|uniref:HNH endonuclease n=1 Tax=Pollutibacter soli TaxID=3034157 RepID=UPI0030135378
MAYAIIVENDISEWKDETGVKYHFPFRYLKYLQPGTKVVYYKGRITDNKFQNKRLSPIPHYFGIAEIGKNYKDYESDKNDFYTDILGFKQFEKAVSAKQENEYIESIPATRATNYWRDGVRPITEEIYSSILKLAEFDAKLETNFNDLEFLNGFQSDHIEGGKKLRYTSYYERNSAARQQAVEIHGYSCMACEFNFKDAYGDWGEGFIHVHHTKPISTVQEKTKVNAKEDLIVLCANCHSMVHRKKDSLLSLKDLKAKLKANKI